MNDMDDVIGIIDTLKSSCNQTFNALCVIKEDFSKINLYSEGQIEDVINYIRNNILDFFECKGSVYGFVAKLEKHLAIIRINK